MHELGLAEGILGVVLEVAGNRPVRRVAVRVGALQRVVPDSLEFGFGLLAEGSAAAGARLVVTQVPARLRCLACGAEEETARGELLCARCGSAQVQPTSGEEILVDEVELDTDPPAVIRRPGLEVVEPPHDHHHDDDAPGVHPPLAHTHQQGGA